MLHLVKKHARYSGLKYKDLHAWLCQHHKWAASSEEVGCFILCYYPLKQPRKSDRSWETARHRVCHWAQNGLHKCQQAMTALPQRRWRAGQDLVPLLLRRPCLPWTPQQIQLLHSVPQSQWTQQRPSQSSCPMTSRLCRMRLNSVQSHNWNWSIWFGKKLECYI
jgi:hypothetical protein